MRKTIKELEKEIDGLKQKLQEKEKELSDLLLPIITAVIESDDFKDKVEEIIDDKVPDMIDEAVSNLTIN